MSLRSQNKAVVYNRAGERIEKLTLSLSEAQAEVDRGNAVWLRSKRGAAIQLSQWDRCDSSPSGIPASTMHANAGGARWARDKVMAWGAMQQANLAALVVQA